MPEYRKFLRQEICEYRNYLAEGNFWIQKVPGSGSPWIRKSLDQEVPGYRKSLDTGCPLIHEMYCAALNMVQNYKRLLMLPLLSAVANFL